MTHDFVHRSPASKVVFRPGAIADLPAELDSIAMKALTSAGRHRTHRRPTRSGLARA